MDKKVIQLGLAEFYKSCGARKYLYYVYEPDIGYMLFGQFKKFSKYVRTKYAGMQGKEFHFDPLEMIHIYKNHKRKHLIKFHALNRVQKKAFE